MKLIASLLLLTMLAGCKKKDIIAYIQYAKKNRCAAVSVNPDKQGAYDFYMIKTVDQYGVLSHLKSQLWDVDGNTFVYDYEISYVPGKAIFKGFRKTYYWYLDNPPVQDPNGPMVYPEPNAPVHPEEQVALRDNRSFDIFLDRKTGYATEVKYAGSSTSELKLTYDRQGRLSRIGAYLVKTDNKNNILSILTPVPTEDYLHGQQLGVRYNYSQMNVANKRLYYETPYIFIHPMYSLLEVLNWGPFQPNRERTGVSIQYDYQGDELPPYIPDPSVNADYSNHQYDERGNLMAYDFDGDLNRPSPYYRNTGHRSRKIVWNYNTIK